MSVCKRQRLKHTGRGEYCEVRLYQAGNQLFVALHIPCSYDTWPSLCLYSLQHTGVQGQHRNTQPSFIPSSVVLNLPCQQSISQLYEIIPTCLFLFTPPSPWPRLSPNRSALISLLLIHIPWAHCGNMDFWRQELKDRSYSHFRRIQNHPLNNVALGNKLKLH